MESQFLKIVRNNQYAKNIYLMLVFGVLSLILGKIEFYIPSIGGGTSELCEVAVLLAVVYLPHWIYIIGVSLILSLGTPTTGSIPVAIFMHSVGGVFAWFFYSNIKNRATNVYSLGLLWVLMVVLYYTVFLIPAAIIGSSLSGLAMKFSKAVTYKNILATSLAELFTTTSVTTLFVLLYKTANILEIKNRHLQLALIKVRESDRLKSAFLANISHEIRTPMNGIIGFCSLLAEPNVPDDKKKNYSEIIINSSNQLLSIINDILDISRIEAGMTEIINSHVPVDNLLAGIESFYKPQIARKSLKFELKNKLSHEENDIVTDRGKLQEILDNLISNALKFTDQGHIILGCERNGNELMFYVEDTGIGIDASFYEKIFERFTQAEVSDGRIFGGTGLGLSIAKGLVELLGGKINFKSDVGKGTVFSFTIPYVRFSKNPENNSSENKSLNFHSGIKDLTILIAEDEEVNYHYFAELFTGLRIKIIHAKNGKEAIEFCRDHPEIDIVLMDIKMPLLNGLEAVREIRTFRNEMPIIAQTAYATVADRLLALDAGCNDFLTKPISRQDILDTIEKFCTH
jgi:signal transduction histidine kinase/CheY-like chemotaxis protein